MQLIKSAHRAKAWAVLKFSWSGLAIHLIQMAVAVPAITYPYGVVLVMQEKR
ncbi:hypothetical protein I5R69_04050 [Serratia marcescens]|nr:hypothetical protein [Serratia marcescens]